MLKKLLTLLVATLLATATWAAVDVNTATEAELDGIKGIGPGLSGRILQERQSCLLYTSPSPRDRQKSRMPSSA